MLSFFQACLSQLSIIELGFKLRQNKASQHKHRDFEWEKTSLFIAYPVYIFTSLVVEISAYNAVFLCYLCSKGNNYKISDTWFLYSRKMRTLQVLVAPEAVLVAMLIAYGVA